jgi:CHAT domain-containing protein
MNNRGFALTGILYSILIIFVASISIMLYNLQNKKTVLDEIKVDASKSVNSYQVYENGTAIYFNPEINAICSENEAVSTTGTKKGCMKWYIFNDTEDSDVVNMILDHNTTAKVVWNSSNVNTSMGEVYEALTNDTSLWDSSLKARLITADEIAKITSAEFSSKTATMSNWYVLETGNQSYPNTYSKKYAWLYDYTDGCTSYGCNVADSNASGYWTSTPVYGTTNYAWGIYKDCTLGRYYVTGSLYGLRPVITISKSIIY